MLNILAWCDVQKKFRITVDTDKGAYIKVHLSDTKVMYFEEVESGLYMFKRQAHQMNKKMSGYSFLTLASANKSHYNRTELERADKARLLHAKLGYPEYKRFFWMLQTGKVKDSKVNVDDAKRVLHIYGPDTALLKGKTTKKGLQRINRIKYVDAAKHIKEDNKNIYLYVYYMYVQGVPILTTISGDYNFRTVDPLMNKRKANKEDMVAGLTKVLKIYRSNGFNVIQVSADNEFECVREAISPTFLNITATNEHMSEVERSIRTIKERTRCQLRNLPYKYYP